MPTRVVALGLRRFTAVPVRDANAQDPVGQALGTQPAVVLADRGPCEATAGKKYAPVYGHGFPDWPADAMRGRAAIRLLH